MINSTGESLGVEKVFENFFSSKRTPSTDIASMHFSLNALEGGVVRCIHFSRADAAAKERVSLSIKKITLARH